MCCTDTQTEDEGKIVGQGPGSHWGVVAPTEGSERGRTVVARAGYTLDFGFTLGQGWRGLARFALEGSGPGNGQG